MAADKRRSAPPGRADYDRAPTAPTDLLPTTQFPTMSSNRRTRLTTVLIALVSLLFMHLALGALPAGFAMPARVTRLSSAPCQTPHLMRTTAPPVAISHCCFRL